MMTPVKSVEPKIILKIIDLTTMCATITKIWYYIARLINVRPNHVDMGDFGSFTTLDEFGTIGSTTYLD